MMNGYTIVENIVKPPDYQALRAVCGMPAVDNPLLEKALAASLVTFAAVAPDGKIVGMTRLVGDGAFVFLIHDLLVDVMHRRRGIGRALTQTALEWVAARIPDGTRAPVSLFSAAGKEQFYEKLGFIQAPNPQMGAGMIIFVKNGGRNQL